MTTMKYEEDGVVFEIERDERGLRAFVIEVPLHSYRMTARRAIFDGRPSWKHKAVIGDRDVLSGYAAWRAVYESVPLRLVSRNGDKPVVECEPAARRDPAISKRGRYLSYRSASEPLADSQLSGRSFG
jgi:hypothetical protein